jgi:hypothetical protein
LDSMHYTWYARSIHLRVVDIIQYRSTITD